VTIRFLLAVLAATPLLAKAGDQGTPSQSDEGSAIEVDVIVVTASRMDKALNSIAGGTSVVGSEVVQHARRQLSLDESMARVPGLFFQNRYNSAQDLSPGSQNFHSRIWLQIKFRRARHQDYR
jgi:iron complex outermembrane receptor protein